jgi:hypothetical protein
LLDWVTTASLYAVSPDGVVHSSSDGGLTWAERGSVQAAPQALLVDTRDGAESLHVAVSPATVRVSTDGGASFSTRYAG